MKGLVEIVGVGDDLLPGFRQICQNDLFAVRVDPDNRVAVQVEEERRVDRLQRGFLPALQVLNDDQALAHS